MNSRAHRTLRATAFLGIVLLLVGVFSSAAGMRVNTSRSIRLGIYWTSADPLVNGSYVFFCPPDSSVMAMARQRGYLQAGPCLGGLGHMMKIVAASAGDVVSISGGGVRVNGGLLPHSMPVQLDPAGRALPKYERSDFVLGETQLLLMSDVSASSFDGRYFGPVERDQIKSVIVPVLTW